jgi:hypothetical protein
MMIDDKFAMIDLIDQFYKFMLKTQYIDFKAVLDLALEYKTERPSIEIEIFIS